MTYDTPSQIARWEYDGAPSEPRRDEQAEAAASGTMSPPDHTAARRTTVESWGGDTAVTAPGCGRRAHGEGPPGVTTQPAGIGTPRSRLAAAGVDHDRSSAGASCAAGNRRPWRLPNGSCSTRSLNAS